MDANLPAVTFSAKKNFGAPIGAPRPTLNGGKAPSDWDEQVVRAGRKRRCGNTVSRIS